VRLEGAEGGLCPGHAYQLVITVTTAGGETVATWSAPPDGAAIDQAGFADFSEFEYKLLGGHLDERGMFVTDSDALPAAGTGYKVAAAVVDDTSVNDGASYDQKIGCTAIVDFSGADGERGYDGGEGTSPDAGEGSANGGQGGDGAYGGNGGEVAVTSALVRTLVHRAAVLIKVVPKDGAARHFLLDPASPDGFTVDCGGGNGGDGGAGGDGAAGGNGGRGGGGGDGGDGGVIRGFFDMGQPVLQQFMKYVRSGGAPGAPGTGGAPGDRDSEGRPMLPGGPGEPGQPGEDGPWPDVRPEDGRNLFPDLPEGVFVLDQPWVPGPPAAPDPALSPAPGAAVQK